MSSQNGWQRVARLFTGHVAVPLKRAYGTAKYRNHAFDKSIDWEWEKIKYNRVALVNLLISRRQEPAYLEIGCASNTLFDSVAATVKVGVDPSEGGTIRATSDEFFQTNNQFFDVVFIDGLHTYEQVRRDVINSIRFLRPGGFVALHDMLPGSWLEHHVPRINELWTGDVWKVAFELCQSQGIEFKVVKIDHGVGVFKIHGEQPNLVDLGSELKEQQFEYFYRNIDKLPLICWQDFLKWLH